MHIKEIVIDGFKSYAHRTVVEGFDPHFNAITGLNGSGKSNILDSICFVLGITNLSQVRAGNLSELVYKQGQAGVNKASVTVVFDNTDDTNSPVGYEQCSEVTVTRQVLLGGKSKYLINGRNSPASQVQNLFHSVQLNVNNPHFLIMQGRITKVLNMKPHEILGMVEEAAGTRMYETKRVAAIKTIDKKQAKVDELNAVLAEEITPTLERLRGEKQNYLKWSKNNADIERNERFVIASDFMRAQKALEANEDGVTEMEEKVAELQATVGTYKEQVNAKDDEISELSGQLQGKFEGELHALRKEEEKQSKSLVKATSTWQLSKDAIAKAEVEVSNAQSAMEDTKKSYTEKETEIEKESTKIEQEKKAATDAEEELATLSSDFQSMSAGLSSSQGDEGLTLPDQISKAHSDSKAAEAKATQAAMKKKHLEKEIKSVEKQAAQEQKSAQKLEEKRTTAKQKVAKLQESMIGLSFDETEFNSLETEQDNLRSSLSELSDLVDTLTAQLGSRLAFQYADPVRGFDRSKVKGLIAKLVHVKAAEHATALEVVSGGKLYQVVVDEAITGKALLSRGNLQRRVTIIPLDKIQPRRVTNSMCQEASRIAKSMNATAYPAIELVGFDEEVRSAMEYVFGASIVVDNAKAANKICDATRTRTVTLDGDVYDPSGTISGGSKNNLGSTLSKLSELSQASDKLSSQKSRFNSVKKTLDALRSKASDHDKMNASVEIAQAELDGIQKQISQTSYGVLVEKLEAMLVELDDAKKLFEEMEKTKVEKWDLYHELKDREIELTQQREVRLGRIEEDIQEAKKRVVEKTKKAREAESRAETLSMELESLRAEVKSAEEAHEAAQQALDECGEDEAVKQMKVGEVKASYDQAKLELNELEDQMSKCSAELMELKKGKSAIEKKIESAKLETKKISVAINRIQKDRSNAERVVASLLKKYSWIESEKSAFGVEGGDYDFEATNPDEMSKHLNSLKAEQDSLTKKINKKVMGMIEKAEGEYTELLRKRKVVENDKKKIQSVIEELDVKKKTELQRTWVKVTKDFGSIFSTLLPGASAKLEPPEGMQAWEGLEVKVAFGNVWKESLSELSGGQRSLLALSLILSLLLFKPAPMYILDEVDAALDLSHTQNIGNMLKTHFSQSQFIVVSLKEGMFNNANVIYRTKFVDGVSTVNRTIGIGSSSRARALGQANQNKTSTEGSRKRQARGQSQGAGKENSVR